MNCQMVDSRRGRISKNLLELRTLILNDLNETDFAILFAILEIKSIEGVAPTAIMIREKMNEHGWPLGKTQLYERLSHLSRIGFVSYGKLEYPRRYSSDEASLMRGAHKWLLRQRNRIIQTTKELDLKLQLLHNIDPKRIASLIKFEVFQIENPHLESSAS